VVVGVIPARLESSRFPRKILALVNDKPMVVCVYEQARQARSLDRVIVAVDAEEVARVLKPLQAEVVMTAKEHPSGTDRVAEVVRDLDTEVVVNIQGDEPLIDPRIIDDLVAEFQDRNVRMATAVSTVITAEDLLDHNTVKVLLDAQRNAVTFRREVKEREIGGYYRHIGLYAYRKETLLQLTQLPPTENERTYRLEQWRALDHGIPIRVVITRHPYWGVDTEEDLRRLLAEIKAGSQ
jgi:3-deoxy-manno-octulosonate cytidylyltransferase (CMP-KDO synthetase)